MELPVDSLSLGRGSVTWLAMRHPTPVASKNEKFLQSQNSMKFAWIIRFRETNSTMRFVSSSKI